MNSGESAYEVNVFPFCKEIDVPTSKSYANRVLILAALSPSPCKVRSVPQSSDVQSMIECLKKIGLDIKHSKNDIIINNSFPSCESSETECLLETGDGGTTNRFLLPFLALGKRRYILKSTERMKKRPMDELFKALSKLGAKCWQDESENFIVQGPIDKNIKRIEIDAQVSTQFASAIFLALSKTNIQIEVQGLQSSLSYLELTRNLVREFKDGKREFKVPVDFSSLSYPLALAAVFGEVLVKNCKRIDRLQADSAFLEHLKEMGAMPRFNSEGLFLERAKRLLAIDLDCSNFPDLVPTLAFICSYADGTSFLRNLGVLRHKESDRVIEILSVLRAFQVSHTYDSIKETLKIEGPSKYVTWREYKPPADHRIVMLTYLFMRVNEGGRLYNAQHVNKSFTHFFEVMGDK